MDGQRAAATCSACGYGLRGLAAAGRCPECGAAYDEAAPVAYVGRPVFGWLLLGVPALVMPTVVWLGLHLAFAPCCLVEVGMWGLLIGGPVAGLLLAGLIGLRLAEWRHGLACRANPANPPRAAAYLVGMTLVLTVVQVALAYCVFAAMDRFGLLPIK